MNVSYEAFDVELFLCGNGLEAFLKEIPSAFVSLIEVPRVYRIEWLHEFPERFVSSPQYQMVMVTHQDPGITAAVRLDDLV
jgi:hypothetical protein